MEPWSVVAYHPVTGEPFGLVHADDSTLAEAEYIARQMLLTFRLSGAFLPTTKKRNTHGLYLFTYTVAPETLPRLGTIWAESFADAEMRLTVLAADGTLLMPSS
jgi:hypothetical protein